ncbi:myeloid-derived growth factor [Bufo gargarizans]|uniref:myeloid-derived growth factor n=1 Tax=Bufo gargarizans TaxID=30331 RepID=UPI001CF31F4F|nr:myeloid-derived growth factor [Bufo gargarizans]
MAGAVVLSAMLLLCLSNWVQAEAGDGSTEEFDVKPGGLDYTYTRRLGYFSCSFSYAAQGGTNEKWHMSIGVDGESRYFSCSIWRPLGTSYLFFTKFEAEVSGGKIQFCEAYSQADKPLKKSEYEIKDTTVSYIPGSFLSSLSKLTIMAESTHAEL